MKNKSILITGGCGFVGRNLIRKLPLEREIWVIDDLSLGLHPNVWLDKSYVRIYKKNNYVRYSNIKQTIHFITANLIEVLEDDLKKKRLPIFDKIFHLASIVGGREVIDGDPILVGKDLAIDSIFFYWLTKNNREVKSVMYASSSAAYPIVLQNKAKVNSLKESLIDFSEYLGVPDMTYGWSKLTGEYLSRLAAERYSIPIACVRPFSGYGEDQDFSYPIPAIARRVGKRENPMTVWGSGKQGRDFVHIDDCIDAFFIIMENIKDGSACNIGSGKLTSFLEVIRIMVDIEGYDPRVNPLLDRPVGVAVRYADTRLVKSFGWKPKISNKQGFERVLSYIKENRS